MTMTLRQRRELRILDFFAQPKASYATFCPAGVTVTDGDTDPVVAYFAWSDQGVRDHAVTDVLRFRQLVDAKSWRGRNIEMYAEGLADVPIFAVVCDMPTEIGQYVTREVWRLRGRTDWRTTWAFMAQSIEEWQAAA